MITCDETTSYVNTNINPQASFVLSVVDTNVNKYWMLSFILEVGANEVKTPVNSLSSS